MKAELEDPSLVAASGVVDSHDDVKYAIRTITVTMIANGSHVLRNEHRLKRSIIGKKDGIRKIEMV